MPILPKKQANPKTAASVWQTDILDIFFHNRKKTIPISSLALFCRKISYLLEAGLPIKSALPILQVQSLGMAVNATVSQVHKHILQGISFSDALKMEKGFPDFMISYIAIGEKTAQLAKVCEKLADYYEQQEQIRKELFATLMYPAAVLLMMLAVITLAITIVLPGYANIFDASDIALPMVTEILLNVSAFFTRNTFFILCGTIALIAVIITLFKSQMGKKTLAAIQLRVPILRQGINFHLAQSLSLLLNSGVNVSDSIPLCIDLVNNIHIKNELDQLSQNLSKGADFSASLKLVPHIDPLLYDMAHVGEKTGNLPQAMEKCCNYFAINYRHNINRINKLIEPVITLVMGILLALLMLAVVLPTFELATSM